MQLHCILLYLFLRPMKIATYIFTTYMLALSLVPCGDSGSGITEIASHFFDLEQRQLSDHEQHSNDCDDDTCSPFCVCSCCSISINVPNNTFLLDRHIPLISQKLVSYDSNFYPSGFSNSIWQPPKFS